MSDRRRRDQAAGFTLVELLVVVGIIAILISVLLPVLGSARRAGQKVKCSASLHQIGDAFKMYAIDNKGYWPIVKWAPNAATNPPGAPAALSWQDFLFPYLHKGTALPLGTFASNTSSGLTELRSDLSVLRFNSALWGCPSFRAADYFNPNSDLDRYSTGYGMTYHVLTPYPAWGYPLTSPGIDTLALYEYSGTIRGKFYKHTTWLRNGSQRGVICDSNNFWMWTNSREPRKSTFSCDPFFDGSAASTFMQIDGARHITPPFSRRKVLGSAGVNMLFADGHAKPVTPYEAYNATMGGGRDILLP